MHFFLVCLVSLVHAAPAAGEAQAHVAIASNLQPVFEELSKAFTVESGAGLQVSAASTGKLAAQIRLGAPFDMLLAADAVTPASLVEEGFAEKDTQQTYAFGKLALYGTRGGDGEALRRTLLAGRFTHLAVAKPALAPYGAAAMQALYKLGIREQTEPKLVYGENISHAFQFVYSGAAELGLVSYAQVLQQEAATYWLLPQDLYEPIRQDAVLLKHGRESATARTFLRFLQSAQARALLERHGYGLPREQAP